MRSLFCLSLLLFASFALSFQYSPRSLVRPYRPTTGRLADTPKYELVPVDKTNVESAAAVTGGVLGFVLGGPVWGVILAAVSNYVVKKEDDSGEALRGFGKTAVESYNFLNKINAKYEISGKLSSALSDLISTVSKKTDSDVLDNVTKTVSETVSKVDKINKEYDLVSKSKEAITAAAQLSDVAIDKAVELNQKVSYLLQYSQVI
jgi:hypothetical protein